MKKEAHSLDIGDAYCRYNSDSMRWAFGVGAVRLELSVWDGQLRLTRLNNVLTAPAVDYIQSTVGQDVLPSLPGVDWKLEQQEAAGVEDGGCRVLRLTFTFSAPGLRLYFHLQAYPNTSVLRLKADIENTGQGETTIQATPLAAEFFTGSPQEVSLVWFGGGCAASGQGQIHRERIDANFTRTLEGTATDEFCPLVVFKRGGTTGDGLMVALEYLGKWRISVTRQKEASVRLNMAMNASETLLPSQRIALPFVFLSTFTGGLDELGVRLYDWQYRYLWDYTKPEYYARPRMFTWWFYTSRNLQEQFAARIANLDLLAEPASEAGYEVLWDDAGWSSHPSDVPPDSYGAVFTETYEGPDFARTQRYLRKKNMKWLLWFCGLPSDGVLATKVGAWGDFEWRTDGMPCGTLTQDRQLRQRIEHFLNTHPESSFHTCSGGGRYMHTFEMQRYGSYHYLSDLGRGPAVNYYFSYFDTPDKSGDILEALASAYGNPDDGSTMSVAQLLEQRVAGIKNGKGDLKYVPETARNTLANVPLPGLYAAAADNELVRQDLDLYRFLRHEGVAGRWSYVFHPRVEGAEEYYFFQRTSHDRRKACVILKCRRPGVIRIYPRGLLPGEPYAVSFAITLGVKERRGADLMENGIVIRDFPARELIFLNLPNRPGSGLTVTPPQRPGTVYARFENNLGHCGVGLYWSPGADEHWISYYEVGRSGQVIAKVSVGQHWFDHDDGWLQGHNYAVRTVNGADQASDWQEATWIGGEPLTYEALGGHFPVAGRDGWWAETTEDGTTFRAMAWVGPAADPSADLGGTPNQPGGVEGYWEGSSLARLGRGWQQASAVVACVRAWTAPKSGHVRVVGRTTKEWYRRAVGEPLRVRILCNKQQIWPTTPPEQPAVVMPSDLQGVSHDFTTNVVAGDRIRFVLEKGSNPHTDLLVWMPLIAYMHAAAPGTNINMVRIACGAREAVTDDDGNRWETDHNFSGGEAVPPPLSARSAHFNEAGNALYQQGRMGRDFQYSIPVTPGLYTVRLKFAEWPPPLPGERPCQVEINGRRVLTDFDITAACRGREHTADKAFHYIVPDGNGRIILRVFSAGRDNDQKTPVILRAFEMLPELRSCIRINAGAPKPFIDWNSFIWSGDQYYLGGATIHSSSPVAQASPTLYDQQLYQTARCGREFSYRIPVTPGLYTVHLKFAELWLAATQRRSMEVIINSRSVLRNFDPATTSQQHGMSADIRFEMISPDAEGVIAIRICAEGVHDAILQGVEIE